MNKEIILQLIKDYIVVSVVANNFRKIGFASEILDLNLPTTILKLLEIKISDENLGVYLEMYDRLTKIDFEDSTELDCLTNEIYDYLLTLKKE
jgi:hypothetical protein